MRSGRPTVHAILALSFTASLVSSVDAQRPGFRGRLIDTTFSPQDAVGALQIADDLPGVATAADIQLDVEQRIEVADFLGLGLGHFGGDQLYPGNTNVPGDGTFFTVDLQADVTIPVGTWQIAFGSDDGGFIQIEGVAFTDIKNEELRPEGAEADTIWFNGNRSQRFTGGTFVVENEPLHTTFRHVFYEHEGRDLSEIVISHGGDKSIEFLASSQWTLLQDGSLGWSVTTDAQDEPIVNVSGKEIIGNHVIAEPQLISTEFTELASPVPGLFMEVYVDHRIIDGDDFRSFLNTVPVPENVGVVPWINWDDGNERGGYRYAQPIVDAVDPLADPLNTNLDRYAARLTGDLLIPAPASGSDVSIQFKDGTEQYAYFAVDLDGDGVLSSHEVLIDDNERADWDGVQGDEGSPIVVGEFTGVGSSGSWRAMEFRMSEFFGEDSAALFWNQNAPELFPRVGAQPATADNLIPMAHFRTTQRQVTAADLEFTFGRGRFDVLAGDESSDALSFEPVDSANLTAVRLSLEGAEFFVDVLDPENLQPGFTIDLIEELYLTEISGTPALAFTNTLIDDWILDDLLTTGQLTWSPSDGGLPGDYDRSGRVDQGDLDLVLLNWGLDTSTTPPVGWTQFRPGGVVGQESLDEVLLNWGATNLDVASASVPEPCTGMLLVLLTAASRWCVRWVGCG